MQDRFVDFCKDDEVQGRLFNIVLDNVDEWFNTWRDVVIGIESSWVARQRAMVHGEQVLGMMNLVCIITDLAPEDIVKLDPEKCSALISYLAKMVK